MVPLHDVQWLDGGEHFLRLKAPGGWLYNSYIQSLTGPKQFSSVFVPDDGLTGRRVREKFADHIPRQPAEGVVLRVDLAPPWDCNDMAFYVALVRYDDGRHETVPVKLLRLVEPTPTDEVSK